MNTHLSSEKVCFCVLLCMSTSQARLPEMTLINSFATADACLRETATVHTFFDQHMNFFYLNEGIRKNWPLFIHIVSEIHWLLYNVRLQQLKHDCCLYGYLEELYKVGESYDSQDSHICCSSWGRVVCPFNHKVPGSIPTLPLCMLICTSHISFIYTTHIHTHFIFIYTTHIQTLCILHTLSIFNIFRFSLILHCSH